MKRFGKGRGVSLGLLPDTVATHIPRIRAAFRKALKNRGR
jgi:hypothetical protein